MKVENMLSSQGNKVANQFIVHGELNGQEGLFFQSYESVICFKPSDGSTMTMDRATWDYSVTTAKYRNQFTGLNTKETKKAIESGSIIIAVMN